MGLAQTEGTQMSTNATSADVPAQPEEAAATRAEADAIVTILERSATAQVEAIDRAILGLPRLEREILKAHYVFKMGPRRSCRRLKVDRKLYGPRLQTARAMVPDLLRRAGVAV
jgi:DNA-directed RNA polymerase specialized sigma24 family protein